MSVNTGPDLQKPLSYSLITNSSQNYVFTASEMCFQNKESTVHVCDLSLHGTLLQCSQYISDYIQYKYISQNSDNKHEFFSYLINPGHRDRGCSFMYIFGPDSSASPTTSGTHLKVKDRNTNVQTSVKQQ